MAETVLPETQISIFFDKLSFPCKSIFKIMLKFKKNSI